MQITEFQNTKGFTLIELLVVISIISILSAVTWVSFSQSSAKSRDSKRQADLKMLQIAIEAYKKDNGRYPAQCGTTGGSADGWSGQLNTVYACSDGSGEYIVGLAPTYIPVLPKDPKLNGTNSGYVYRTNAAGTVYKIKAQRTVEADTITYQHPFKPCDIRFPHTPTGDALSVGGVNSTDPRYIGWCGRVPSGSGSALPTTCYAGTNEGWTKSYGLWGGLAPLKTTFINNVNENIYKPDPLEFAKSPNPDLNRVKAIQDTTDVICK